MTRIIFADDEQRVIDGIAPVATPLGFPTGILSGSGSWLTMDANNRATLARRLTQRGYIVEVAGDGPQALDRIPNGHYDLVLLDQMMPGMSGLEVLRRLRGTYRFNGAVPKGQLPPERFVKYLA